MPWSGLTLSLCALLLGACVWEGVVSHPGPHYVVHPRFQHHLPSRVTLNELTRVLAPIDRNTVLGVGHAPPAQLPSLARRFLDDIVNTHFEDDFEDTLSYHDADKRQYADYGHLRFGKRAEFGDYGHLRFGRSGVGKDDEDAIPGDGAADAGARVDAGDVRSGEGVGGGDSAGEDAGDERQTSVSESGIMKGNRLPGLRSYKRGFLEVAV